MVVYSPEYLETKSLFDLKKMLEEVKFNVKGNLFFAKETRLQQIKELEEEISNRNRG